MATKKITVTLPTDLIDLVNETAAETGMPVSRLVTSALEREMRRRLGLAIVAKWEAEHGAFTPAEIAEVRAKMATADAAYLAQTDRTVA